MKARFLKILPALLALLSWVLHPAVHPHLPVEIESCEHSHTCSSHAHESHSHSHPHHHPEDDDPCSSHDHAGCEVCTAAVEFDPDMLGEALLARWLAVPRPTVQFHSEETLLHETVPLTSLSHRGPPCLFVA
jgi:hypothetical protein